MNYDLIIDDLNKWNIDEQFYKDYYLCVEAGKSTEPLRKRKDIDPEIIQYVVDPDSIDPFKTEVDFFNTGRNVSLIKHPRYFPYFAHRHAFFEMLYVLSGHCEEVTNDRTVELKAGDLCLLAPNVTHGIRVFDDSVIINILIRRSTFIDIFLNTIRDKSQLSLFFFGSIYKKNQIRYLLYRTSEDEIIRNYILDMYMEQTHLDEYSDRIICSILTLFFTQLTRRHGRTVEMPNVINSNFEYGDEILSYIMNHYETITLNELANHFHFSVPYCSKIIHSITGASFSDLVTEIKLQQAENLLSHTQLSVADISSKVGYKNPETFIRAFNRIYHMSPSQYRKTSLLTSTAL